MSLAFPTQRPYPGSCYFVKKEIGECVGFLRSLEIVDEDREIQNEKAI